MKKNYKRGYVYVLSFILTICMMSGVAFARDINSPLEKKSSSIKWNGHASFTITNGKGTRIVTDPFGDGIGYKVPELYAEIATVSHDHFDHNNLGAIISNFTAIRERGKFKINGIKIKGTKTYHDTEAGAQRGENTVYTYNIDGVNLCHLGDLGHELSKEQIESIGKVDILMIPVGGLYTIDGEVAAKVVSQLNPKVVIPMHYQTEVLVPEFGKLSKVDSFIEKMNDWQVVKADTFTFNKSEITKSKEKKIVVLNFNK
ncbi:MBL fold metallo-hydrolase [Clostridium tagluense]|uniref:MBL fold metallo-hydrolase n=1 Tax=Clostridium tagluense TaxID=360422 RepID=UPI001CF3776A|nr:MBL fold metallo-hydrolase [Clostridium tagluense]MCB2310754.1 MBL fold metallo-hydrolase [Clostridium tagluense]MCB2315516.1 MBL fold metallo-hydrolase [Clostridium tagluense]MCB2320370.1 MBL fold metallo-hydrolase [Clostridium tagluense]MCB2325347.1 MBL fold metallo-hydrolase [Clostridium tagluense]MCB2330199.1 MBL fold metallo-hydrolase [Clostridium tagluense]